LLTATTPHLPLGGRRSSEAVDFGDRTLLLVMSPTTELGGRLLFILPWIIGALGLLATLGAATLTERLLRRRDEAEQLARDNARLYANQRSVAETLQHSLLPEILPHMPGVDLAFRYLPGASGVDIGGDWYDVIPLDDTRVMIVVGDVSGRGVRAGAVMASLRFAIRAFASQGDSPPVILAKLTRLVDVDHDDHFATVLCAIVDVAAHTLAIANAGHPNPLLLHGDVVGS
jgi:serine phosphatase RsbU (regulator of sigma subunit)